jgi:hypothetical protein
MTTARAAGPHEPGLKQLQPPRVNVRGRLQVQSLWLFAYQRGSDRRRLSKPPLRGV